MSAQKGNLTGIPRKVKDNCADLHNAVQEWNALVVDGAVELRAISQTSLDLKAKSNKENEDDAEKSLEGEKEIQWNLQAYSENLSLIHQKMGSLVDKMQRISSQFETLISLHSTTTSLLETFSSPKESSAITSPTSFHAWSAERFFEAARIITSAYAEEHISKGCVAESIAHVHDRTTCTYLLACWIHEPHITTEVPVQLEAMLTESGHRHLKSTPERFAS